MPSLSLKMKASDHKEESHVILKRFAGLSSNIVFCASPLFLLS